MLPEDTFGCCEAGGATLGPPAGQQTMLRMAESCPQGAALLGRLPCTWRSGGSCTGHPLSPSSSSDSLSSQILLPFAPEFPNAVEMVSEPP